MSLETKKMMMLIVDDNPLLCNVLSAMLRRHDVQTQVACDLRSARELWKNARFDGAFVDLNLPDGCGTELRNEFEGPEKLVVGMTSGNIEALRSSGFLHAIRKPIAESTLVSLLGSREARVEKTITASKGERWASIVLKEINTPALHAVLDLDDISQELLSRYLQTGAEALRKEAKKMDTQLSIRDIRKSSHRMKGICANLGADELFQLFAQLEEHPELFNIDMQTKIDIRLSSLEHDFPHLIERFSLVE